MVVTHFMLGGMVALGRALVVVIVAEECAIVVTGLDRVVWISARRTSATLSFSLICSICSCSSCSSPGRGGAIFTGGRVIASEGGDVMVGGSTDAGAAEVEGMERTTLVNETGPPFSHSRLVGPALSLAGPSFLAPPPLASEAVSRESRRRVFRVSRLKWTRLKSRASVAAESAVAGGPEGVFCRLQLNRKRERRREW